MEIVAMHDYYFYKKEMPLVIWGFKHLEMHKFYQNINICVKVD